MVLFQQSRCDFLGDVAFAVLTEIKGLSPDRTEI
jgi:hypothetical protein